MRVTRSQPCSQQRVQHVIYFAFGLLVLQLLVMWWISNCVCSACKYLVCSKFDSTYNTSSWMARTFLCATVIQIVTYQERSQHQGAYKQATKSSLILVTQNILQLIEVHLGENVCTIQASSSSLLSLALFDTN